MSQTIDAVSAASRPPARIVRRQSVQAHRDRSRLAQQVLRMISPFLLLAIWQFAAQVGLDRRFFPPPSEIVFSGWDMLVSGQLLDAVGYSLRRLVLGYGLGAFAGAVVGLLLGLSSWLRSLLEPWLLLTYPVPKLAIYPLLVLLVGLGDLPIVILLAIAVFYIVAINACAGVQSIKPVILDVGRDCNATFIQSAWTIALPASLPHIMTSLEISLGIAYIVLVAAEFVGADRGLGSIIWSSWQLFDVAPMYVAITTVSVIGYLSVLGLRAAGRRLMPWR